MLKLSAEQINYLYPVTGCYFTESGLQVRRGNRIPGRVNAKEVGNIRGAINGLSQRSLHRLAFLVETSKVKFLSMLTLTYGEQYPQTGKETRRHRNTFLTWFRRTFDAASYVWFLEFQHRGAPHIHILLSIKSPGEELETRTARQWCKIVSRDFPGTHKKMLRVHCYRGEVENRMWSNIRKIDGANRYMRKYAGKQSQKRVPVNYSDIGRFWGTSRDVPRCEEDMLDCVMSEAELRRLLRVLGRENVAEWDVLPKYIHVSR